MVVIIFIFKRCPIGIDKFILGQLLLIAILVFVSIIQMINDLKFGAMIKHLAGLGYRLNRWDESSLFLMHIVPAWDLYV